MIDLSDVATKLEALGVRHAPEHDLMGSESEPSLRWRIVGGQRRAIHEPKGDGRHVTLRDEPGVYYLLSTDLAKVSPPRSCHGDVQLTFLKVSAHDVGKYAGAIGYKTKLIEMLPSPDGPVYSVIMEPL